MASRAKQKLYTKYNDLIDFWLDIAVKAEKEGNIIWALTAFNRAEDYEVLAGGGDLSPNKCFPLFQKVWSITLNDS